MRGLPLSRIALAAVRGRSGAPYCPPADFYVLALQSCLLIQRPTDNCWSWWRLGDGLSSAAVPAARLFGGDQRALRRSVLFAYRFSRGLARMWVSNG